MLILNLRKKHGRRCSAKNAFIDPIRARKKHLVIETRAFAKKILIENGRAVGVVFTQNGQERTIRAKREIVLAAGAVQSPQLLELSGIGQGANLQSLGIDVIRDLKGVGGKPSGSLYLQAFLATKRIR